jgi:SAM-dependent methyltransferase
MRESHPSARLPEAGDADRREDWNRRYATSELVWSAEPNRFLVAEVERMAPGRALDLACGEGRNAVWLAERGWRVHGVDFSEVGLAKAERLAAARGVEVEWTLADVTTYEAEEEAWDLVLVLYLQLPADERRLALERAARAVAPGGTLLVLGHDLANLTEGWGGPRHADVLFTAEEVAAELPGLTVERAERVLRSVPVDGREETAVDALVRARRPAPTAQSDPAAGR